MSYKLVVKCSNCDLQSSTFERGTSMKSTKKVVQVPVNIALVKYWGKRDEDLVLPLNDSVSLSVDALWARTEVEVIRDGRAHEVYVNEKCVDLGTHPRYGRLFTEALRLQRKRNHADDGATEDTPMLGTHFKVTSVTNFPTSAGLASSAAGFAAIAFALQGILQLDDRDANRLARLGSGSACRSTYGGLVHWHAGVSEDGSDCFAEEVHSDTTWPTLRCMVFVLDEAEKKVGSTEGMRRSVATSALLKHRASAIVPQQIDRLTKAYKNHNFVELAQVIMQDSNQFHAICMDTFPPLKYLTDGSWKIMDLVDEFNDPDIRAAYTFDAGSNPCVFLEEESVVPFLNYVVDSVRIPQSELDDVRREYKDEVSLVENYTADVTASMVVSTVGGGPRELSSS